MAIDSSWNKWFIWSLKVKRNVALVLRLVSIIYVCFSFSGAQALDVNAEKITGTGFLKHQVTDSTGREIFYYLSERVDKTKPMFLMLQGSGCDSIMKPAGDGYYSTLYNLIPYNQSGEFNVLAVEKPFSGLVSDGGNSKCRTEFNDDFSADSWLGAISSVINDVKTKYNFSRFLVLGLSEGAVIASALAEQEPSITDVVLLGGSGTTQLYDFIVNAYEHCFNVTKCIDEIETDVAEIYSDPLNTKKFKWGHTFKRWTSFMSIDPSDALLNASVNVYIIFGTADNSTPALSQELISAKLMSKGRKVSVRRVVDANHMLMTENSVNFEGLNRELELALKWFKENSNKEN